MKYFKRKLFRRLIEIKQLVLLPYRICCEIANTPLQFPGDDLAEFRDWCKETFLENLKEEALRNYDKENTISIFASLFVDKLIAHNKGLESYGEIYALDGRLFTGVLCPGYYFSLNPRIGIDKSYELLCSYIKEHEHEFNGYFGEITEEP